jgi:hypothetical protein
MTGIPVCFSFEHYWLPLKKYLHHLIGHITTVITYSIAVVSLLQLCSKETQATGTIKQNHVIKPHIILPSSKLSTEILLTYFLVYSVLIPSLCDRLCSFCSWQTGSYPSMSL